VTEPAEPVGTNILIITQLATQQNKVTNSEKCVLLPVIVGMNINNPLKHGGNYM
jgi:hypothetical protein